jgi:FkbM family methyltransferase
MFLSEVLRPGMTFIDVGANDGLYSLFAARRVAPTGRVLALEPSLREFSRLEKNIHLNKFTGILPLRLAVSDREGVGTLCVAGFGHEGQNTLGDFAYDIERAGTEQVPMTTLDQMVDRYDLQAMDVLKIDAEGAELAILKGANSAIAKFRPLILLELVEAALVHQFASRQAIINLLESAGYRFAVFGAAGQPEIVNRVDSDGVNIIAVHLDSKISV